MVIPAMHCKIGYDGTGLFTKPKDWQAHVAIFTVFPVGMAVDGVCLYYRIDLEFARYFV